LANKCFSRKIKGSSPVLQEAAKKELSGYAVSTNGIRFNPHPGTNTKSKRFYLGIFENTEPGTDVDMAITDSLSRYNLRDKTSILAFRYNPYCFRSTWLAAIYLLTSNKKGIPSHQLAITCKVDNGRAGIAGEDRRNG
jgi:hypothetical protein